MRKILLGLALPVVLAGCDLGPGPVKPTIQVPTQWDATTAHDSAAVWPAPDWWKSFGSAELDGLIAEAKANNLDLAAAAARVQQAEAQLRVSGSSLWPMVSLGTDLRQRGPVDDGTLIEGSNRKKSSSLSSDLSGGSSGSTSGGGGGSSTSQRSSLEVSLTASYELDFWGRNHDNVEAARQQLNASTFDRETVALTVTSGVASTYLQVLTLKDRIALAQQNLVNAQQVLKVVEAKARDGAVSGLDLAQQRSQVASQQAAIPPLQLQEKQAMNALALLLGRNPEGFAVKATGLGGITLPTPGAGLPSGLLRRRPDIQEAEANLAAANANLLAARAAMLPTVDLSSSLNLEAIATSLTFGGVGAAYSAAASLAQPIFDAGNLKAQKDVAQGKQLELVQTYRSTILTALSDVENALASVDSLMTQQQFQAAQTEQAQKALTIAQVQYKAGSTELLPVLDAQRTLFQAQDQQASLSLSQLQAAVALYKALGGGWQGSNATKVATIAATTAD
ncbi:MAG TPA: efflux transporter outer membrane subunit [Dongiaceae bacterium]|nr:efflux transporter outer membrane subunit [Dongiaceae bacterium]